MLRFLYLEFVRLTVEQVTADYQLLRGARVSPVVNRCVCMPRREGRDLLRTSARETPAFYDFDVGVPIQRAVFPRGGQGSRYRSSRPQSDRTACWRFHAPGAPRGPHDNRPLGGPRGA